jgi:hypothetical protein
MDYAKVANGSRIGAARWLMLARSKTSPRQASHSPRRVRDGGSVLNVFQ